MEHRAISFYNQFSCAGGQCPQTCCKGWKILVDEETYQNIRQEPGRLGRKLRRSMVNGDMRYIRQTPWGCPFLNKEGLCRLQAAGKMDCMSWICQEYPRRILEFGQFTETTLELACPQVAQIFLENKEPLTMDVMEAPPRHVMWKMDNEDKGFLRQLEALRSQTMAEISACPHFDRVAMQQLYEHYDKLHHLVVRNKLQALEGEISALRLTGGDGTRFLFYPMEMMDKVIAYNLDESGLAFKLPELKKLIKGYYRYFNGFTGQQAADFYHTHRKRMQQALPETEEKYRAYYQYYLLEMLLTGYEDYHVLKVILLGHMYLQIYMVLDLVAWLDAEAKGEAYDISRQALVLSNLERRMRHNTGITDGILGRIRQDFL